MKTAPLLPLLLLLAAHPASATSYMPISDEALVDQAPVIAVVEVQRSVPGQDGARPFTGYRMRVERVLKGALASDLRITVRVPGGARADGLKLRIWGAPRFSPGERALLFLSPRMDGTYDVVHLMLGAFHEVRSGRHRLAVRHLSEARAIARPGEPLPAETLRDFDRFVRWVAARTRGMRVQADYQVADPGLDRITDDFTVFEDPADGYAMRWFEFDGGGSIAWLAHQDGQVGLAGGGFAEFQTALAAWNDDPDSDIAYTYAGTTTDTSGLIEYDTLNSILFNDPNGELPFFSCSSGGVLAYAGPWYFSETTPHQGTLYHRIANADVVINNGLTCFFEDSPDGSAAAEELFTHELGHTLGIGHSEVNEAVMRSFIHDDGRGASLHADDRAAAFYLYGVPAPRDFFTLAPCRLLDTRDPNGPYGGPILSWWEDRTISAAGQCGIPATAVALSINITAVAPSSGGDLTLAPGGWPQPATSVISFSAGQTRSNNALLFLSGGAERAFTIFPGADFFGTVHVVIDVNGYFE